MNDQNKEFIVAFTDSVILRTEEEARAFATALSKDFGQMEVYKLVPVETVSAPAPQAPPPARVG